MATNRAQLLQSIAAIIADCGQGEIAAPTPQHVERWVSQFDADAQEPILEEMAQVLPKTYFPKTAVQGFLDRIATHPNVAGPNPAGYWAGIKFLHIQNGGKSQKVMLDLFDQVLKTKFGLTLTTCGQPAGPFFYLLILSGFDRH